MLVGIFSVTFCVIIMAIAPVFAQYTAYQGINDKNFKRVKIKRLKFLFKALGGQSVEKHGVIIPMLFVQVFGYTMSVLTLIAAPILIVVLNVHFRWKIITIISFVVLGFVIITYVCVNIATIIVSKRIDSKNSNAVKGTLDCAKTLTKK